MEAQVQPAAALTCPTCHTKLQPNFYFCPNCGRKVKGAPPSVSVISQIGVYALSFFLPPLGLVPGVKYLLQPDRKVKTVGIICIALTALSVVITFIIMAQVAEQYMKLLNGLSSGTYNQGLYGL